MKLRRAATFALFGFVAILAAVFCFAHASFEALSSDPNHVTITLLSTTDIHGHIEPWDYYAGKPANLGLAKIATLVKQARKEAPDALLLDCGDTIQGTPLAYFFAEKDPSKRNPIIAAFNAMHYDAMAVGNHEFNFGEDVMFKAMRESTFPWLAANVAPTNGKLDNWRPWPGRATIKNVAGVRIGIVGFVTPGIPRWEIPAHYEGYEFLPIVAAAKSVIPEVRKQADLVVVIMHSGLDGEPSAGTTSSDQVDNENVARQIAEQVPGIDVIFFGHTHLELPELFINGVLLAQAKYWGQSLARADVTMTRGSEGHWQVESKLSKTIPVTPDVVPDEELMKLMEPYQEATEKYLSTPIAISQEELTGKYARFEDNALVDLIHKVQLEAAHADVSMATMFYTGARVPAGSVTIRGAAALYIYENTLYAVEMTGAQLKDALEHAASFFPSWPFRAGQPMQLPRDNADSAAGVSYVMDLTQPAGERIRDLQFHGKPLGLARKLRVAINSYRYTGGGSYNAYKNLPIVYRSPKGIRDLLIDYLARTKSIRGTPEGNWKVVPREALAAIKEAADQETRDYNRQGAREDSVTHIQDRRE